MKYPKGIKAVYDNGGKTIDQYTIYYNHPIIITSIGRLYMGIGVGNNYFNHGEGYLGRHNGKKISWNKLPKYIREKILNLK